MASDAAKAADDVVVDERVDHPLRASGGEHLSNLSADEELSQRRQRIKERTDAENDQQDLSAGVNL